MSSPEWLRAVDVLESLVLDGPPSDMIYSPAQQNNIVTSNNNTINSQDNPQNQNRNQNQNQNKNN